MFHFRREEKEHVKGGGFLFLALFLEALLHEEGVRRFWGGDVSLSGEDS